jgi:hypothetical protein
MRFFRKLRFVSNVVHKPLNLISTFFLFLSLFLELFVFGISPKKIIIFDIKGFERTAQNQKGVPHMMNKKILCIVSMGLTITSMPTEVTRESYYDFSSILHGIDWLLTKSLTQD